MAINNLSVLNIYGGDISATAGLGKAIYNIANLTITGGTISGTTYAIQNDLPGVVTLQNATINGVTNGF